MTDEGFQKSHQNSTFQRRLSADESDDENQIKVINNF